MCINTDKCKAIDYQGDKQSTTMNVFTTKNDIVGKRQESEKTATVKVTVVLLCCSMSV